MARLRLHRAELARSAYAVAMADSTSAAAQGVSEQLKAIYNERFRPVEAATGFGNSYTNGELSDSWFDSPPMVLLIGPGIGFAANNVARLGGTPQ